MKCILIETKDKRKFLTYEKNLDQIQLFAQIFEANIKKVNSKEGKILDLKELASALCEVPNKKEEKNYNLIEEKTKNKIIKKQKPSIAIRNFIYQQLASSKNVSIKELKEKFKNYNLCDATFYNHLRKVKENLKSQQ